MSGKHFFLALSLAGAELAHARVTGHVADASGGALAGATIVVVESTNARQVATTETDNGGNFGVSLPSGLYTVRASAPLFRTVEKRLSLSDGDEDAITVNFVLPLAGVVERVTVSERAETSIEGIPGSVAYVDQREIEDSLAHSLKDALGFTPGVVVQPRFGADESQISIRGSGLRNNFHLRGLNVFVNGIPYQDADGFGDFESIDLMASAGIEIFKGANALRYGANSMGGAINIWTHTGETASPLQAWLQGGSFGHFKGQVSTGGTEGKFRFYGSFSDTELEGYREHSDQKRKRLFTNLGYSLDAKTDLRFDFMYADVFEKLPGALTKDGMRTDPRSANPENVEQDWGRFYDYFRVAAGLNREIDASQRFEVSAHVQFRDMVHPIFQVLTNESLTSGLDVTYHLDMPFAGRENDLVVGVSPQWGTVDEQRFANVGGQSGQLAAQFKNHARNFGVFFEDRLSLVDEFRLVIGGRADWARREFVDLFLTDGDRSDERTFSAFVPKLGFVWGGARQVQIYGNASRSYEPPLLLELTSFGSPGFLDLKAQDTWQFEIGSRGDASDAVRWDVALFEAEIHDEILNISVRPFPGAPFTIPSYRNADKSRHVGIEVGTELEFEPGVVLRTAYTWSRFRFVGDEEFRDNDLPGAPRHLLRTELRFDHDSGFWLAPNVDWSPSSYFVDSANTVSNDDYAVVNLKAGYDFNRFGLFFQGSNLTDRVYSGSVQVDSADGRFFEPSNGRSGYVGIRWRLQ